MTNKKRVKEKKSFSFELDINNDKLKKTSKTKKMKKTKMKKTKKRKIVSLPEETIAWTIKGGKKSSLKKKKSSEKVLKPREYSLHLERKYCINHEYFSKFSDPEKQYYKEKREYRVSTIEPQNNYKRCMDDFNKTFYGQLKQKINFNQN
jgi:hypothetical protein